MRYIAAENNLAETEIDLCGHAILASAFVISLFVDSNAVNITFHTKIDFLSVQKQGDMFEMNFSSRKPLLYIFQRSQLMFDGYIFSRKFSLDNKDSITVIFPLILKFIYQGGVFVL